MEQGLPAYFNVVNGEYPEQRIELAVQSLLLEDLKSRPIDYFHELIIVDYLAEVYARNPVDEWLDLL